MMFAKVLLVVMLTLPVLAGAGEITSIPTNRKLDVIKVKRGPNPYRRMYAQAGRRLGPWTIQIAEVRIDGAKLIALAEKSPQEPFLRVLREELKRPFDKDDFLFFLDDVLLAGRKGLRSKPIWVPSGRARNAGILIHPDDVFKKDKPRLYGQDLRPLAIDKPEPQTDLTPAEDGAVLGPNWTTRYKNPIGEEAKLKALVEQAPSKTFVARVESLIKQLRAQGCQVVLWTTVRNRHRGYLMWGAYMLSRKGNKHDVIRAVRLLEQLNQDWQLDVPIRWYHPGGWRMTVDQARMMADTYDVTYASRRGAQKSRHYDGEAVDLSAVGLPRSLSLTAPNGAEKTFDLSDPEQTRDLCLTPELIDWLEENFVLNKLRKDYAHFNDAAKPTEVDLKGEPSAPKK
ncbi:MAG: hypothetical protein JRJ87_16075 [Deltaproteobacteria bacterium]|nr:hypothetical protein [Deltaproteobacteria bacterium]